MDKILDKMQVIINRLQELDVFLDAKDLTDEQIYWTLSELKSLDIQLMFLRDTYEAIRLDDNPTDIGGC